MHFSRAAVLIALLPALGSATCTRCKSKSKGKGTGKSDSLAASMVNAGNAAGANDCGDSSFVKVTMSNRPLVADCQQLVANLAGNQEWRVTTSGVQVAVYQTCAFNAVSFGGDSIIGNADVIDLINDSISKFEDNGYVGAQGSYNMYVASSGSVPCSAASGGDQQVRVDWSIVHP